MIQKGSKVQIHYTLTVDGEKLESSQDGDPLPYTHGEGQIVPGLARVSGIVRTGSPSVALGLCLLPIGTVRAALGYDEGEATQVALFLHDNRDSAHVVEGTGWHPEERLTMRDAIRAYTWGSAYASFEEKTKGTIEVGRLADVVVLSRNLLEIEPAELLDTEVLFTIAGGRVVYEKP